MDLFFTPSTHKMMMLRDISDETFIISETIKLNIDYYLLSNDKKKSNLHKIRYTSFQMQHFIS